MKLKIRKQIQENLENSSSSSELKTVKTPFYRSFQNAWVQVDSVGAKHRVLRDFWEALLSEEKMLDSVDLELHALRLSYEFLALDHQLAKVELPDKVKLNLFAARKYDVNGFSESMRGLIQVSQNSNQTTGGDEMATKKKTERTGVVHLYLPIFEAQGEKKLTDEQIADAVEKACGNRPSVKNVASYRCYFNKGKLAGQKSKPKEQLKAVRAKVEKAPKEKKPMSEETKAKLKAYSASKKAAQGTKLKIKKTAKKK